MLKFHNSSQYSSSSTIGSLVIIYPSLSKVLRQQMLSNFMKFPTPTPIQLSHEQYVLHDAAFQIDYCNVSNKTPYKLEPFRFYNIIFN